MNFNEPGDCWKILQIEVTNDKNAIRKAYLKLLRDTNPEEKPDEFMKLREAYEHALNWASLWYAVVDTNSNAGADESNSLIVPDARYVSVDEPQVESSCPENADPPKSNQEQNKNEAFYEQISDLYADFERRIELKNWTALVESWDLINLQSRFAISQALLFFFAQSNQLPQEILRFFDRIFNWSGQMLQYKKMFPFLAFKLDELDDRIQLFEWNLDYTSVKNIPRREEYLNFREEVIKNLVLKDVAKVKKGINEIRKICPKDSTLDAIRYHLTIIESDDYAVKAGNPKQKKQPRALYLMIFALINLIVIIYTSVYTHQSRLHKLPPADIKQIEEYIRKKQYDAPLYNLNGTALVYGLTGTQELGKLEIIFMPDVDVVNIKVDIAAAHYPAPDYFIAKKSIDSSPITAEFNGILEYKDDVISAFCYAGDEYTMILWELTRNEKLTNFYKPNQNERLLIFGIFNSYEIENYKTGLYSPFYKDFEKLFPLWSVWAKAYGIFYLAKE